MLGSINIVSLIVFVKYFKGLVNGNYEYEVWEEEDDNGNMRRRTIRRSTKMLVKKTGQTQE